MAADIVPIKLALTDGDLFTLWAPRWRDAGDEWEAFLGKDDDLYAFASVPDLVAFVRTNTDNDLNDHPAWETLTEASAHKLDAGSDHQFDVVGVPDVLAEPPTEESLESLKSTLAVVSALGSVCELPTVTKFFNGNPTLGTLTTGVDYFTGRAGTKRWHQIGSIVDKSWDNIITALEEVISTPDVDEEIAARAEAELLEPPVEDEVNQAVSAEVDDADATDDEDDDDDEATEDPVEEVDPAVAKAQQHLVLGTDEDFWGKVGIDPVRIITGGGTFYTLRCYLEESPIFLGRNGRISVFGSERSLARYLADEHDHDLSDLSTYDDIRTAATDGSLEIDITPENVYVLTGLGDDITDGPDAVDHDQFDLAVEFLRDVGDYSEDDTVDTALAEDSALGEFVGYVLEPDSASKPAAPFVEAAEQWTELEQFVESRLRRE